MSTPQEREAAWDEVMRHLRELVRLGKAGGFKKDSTRDILRALEGCVPITADALARLHAAAREPERIGSGIKVEAVHKFGVKLDRLPPAGEHLWVYVAMFRVRDPSAQTVNLDLENLLTIQGVGCFLCEKTFAQVDGAPCEAKR